MRKVEEICHKFSHEEVNSWMLLHAKFVNTPNTHVIRTVDTGILVITLCIMPNLYEGLKGWIEFGLTSNYTLR